MADDSHNRSTSLAWRQHRAVRSLAHHAQDATELAEFLDMLDLTAATGLTPPEDPPIPLPRRLRVKLDETSACRLSNLLRATT